MSTKIDWPYKPLPRDAHNPPYTLFAIDGEPIHESEFPAKVGLGLVLHFAPILEHWLVDADTGLPVAEKRAILDKPYVGINLPGSVARDALKGIVRRMVQLSGRPRIEPQDFDVSPSIVYALQIVTAWRKLQLPAKGTERLELHLYAALTLGPPVSFEDIKTLWVLYPPPSLLMKEAALNFVQAFIKAQYRGGEATRIQSWVKSDPNVRNFFAQVEAEYRFKAELQNPPVRRPSDTPRVSIVTAGSAKSAEIIDKDGTKRVTPEERKDQLKKDPAGVKQRVRRLKRDPPLRSIHDEDEDEDDDPRSKRSASAGPSGRPRSSEIDAHPHHVISFSSLGAEAGDELSRVLESWTQGHDRERHGEFPMGDIEVYYL